MITCVEYMYYFEKRWKEVRDLDGIQVVPFTFTFLEALPDDINLDEIDQNSIFRFILYPEDLIDSPVNFLFEVREVPYIRERISKSLGHRYLPSHYLMYQTSETGNNFLEIDETIIQNMKDVYNNLQNNINPNLTIFPHNWIKHTILYWDFKIRNFITYSQANDIGFSSYLDYAIGFISLYEQIYYLLKQNIPELP